MTTGTYSVGYDIGYDPDNPTGGGGGTDLWFAFDTPLFTGNVGFSDDVPFPFGCTLDGRPVMLDLHQTDITGVEQLRGSRDAGALPSEATLSTEGGWKRTRANFVHGAGQTWADSVNFDEDRFFASKGLDPWTRRELKLLPDTDLAKADVSATNMQLRQIGAHFYFLHGAVLEHTSDPHAASPSWTAVTGASGTLGIMATDGNEIFYVDSVGLRRSTTGSSTSAAYGGTASGYKPTALGVVDGWFVGGHLNVLSQIDNAGTLTEIWTHPNAGFVWTAIVGHPEGIFVGGQAPNGLAEIYRIDITSDGSRLDVPVFVGSLPLGEAITCGAQYQGFLLFGSTKGLHGAAVQINRIDVGNFIPTPASVLCMAEESRFVWFGWSNCDTVSTGLGRADLSQFTDAQLSSFPLQPAYATDLMYAGQGQVTAVARFADRTYFCITGVGLVRQEHTGKLVVSGTLDLGRFTWDLFEPKSFLGAEIVVEPLQGAVAAAVIDDGGQSTGLGTLSIDGTTGLGTNLGGNVRVLSDSLRPVLTLYATTDQLAGPVLRRFSMWVLPIPRNVKRYTLAVMLKESIDIPVGDGQEYVQDVLALWNWLEGLEGGIRAVTLQIGKLVRQVSVHTVSMPQGAIEGWATDRGWLTGTAEVVCLTKEFS